MTAKQLLTALFFILVFVTIIYDTIDGDAAILRGVGNVAIGIFMFLRNFFSGLVSGSMTLMGGFYGKG